MIITGRALFGDVDRVPGAFYLSTQFFHFNFLPIMPLQSFIVLEGTETKGGFKGAKTDLSLRSVLVAYMRAFLVLLGIVLVIVGGVKGCIALSVAGAQDTDWFLCLVVSLAGGCSLWLFRYSRTLFRASRERAQEMASTLGLTTDTVERYFDLQKHAGNPPEGA